MSLCIKPLSPSPYGTGLILRNCPADGGPAKPLTPGDLVPTDVIKRTVSAAKSAVATTVRLVEQAVRKPWSPVILLTTGAALGGTLTAGLAAVALIGARKMPTAVAASFLVSRAAVGVGYGATAAAGALLASALRK